MDLLIIRHAIAEDRDAFAPSGRDDSERPLTAEGREKMRRVAEGLRGVVASIDVLASSPYARALETARIVAASYGMADDDIEVVDALVPERPLDRFVSWIQRRSMPDVVAIVGHEPHLSRLATWLMSGLPESRVELKKGGACLVAFEGQPGPGVGVMRWLLTPKQLRDLRATT
jgi:phosphohistidine phosphatase